MRLFLATKNRDKIQEIKEILSDLNIDVFTIDDFPEVPDVIEDSDTITGNACKKALETAKYVQMYVISDDTGLFVNALNGNPGVYSARFAGENCSYADNRKKLLKIMNKHSDKSALFKTVVAFASPNGIIETFYGEVQGTITDKVYGSNGFGYDAIFKVKDIGKTYAEMKNDEKNKISHRGLALKIFKKYLEKFIEKEGAEE